MNQKVIDRIKKLLALSGNNTSASEAESAALMAQKLMAQYDISISQVDDIVVNEEIDTTEFHVGAGKKWKLNLASVVARNFKCKVFKVGNESIVFYGFKTDTIIAKEVYEFLFKTGNRLATQAAAEYREKWGTAKGIYNSFVMGFLAGVKSKLDEQCLALMIVTPKEVEDKYKKFTKENGMRDSRARLSSSNFNQRTYDNGYREGQNASGRKYLNA